MTRTLAATFTLGLGLVAGVVGSHAQAPATSVAQAPVASKGLTAVPGVKVGHHTLSERPTGCTVILLPADTLGSVDVRRGGLGTQETDLLDPVNNVQVVHAVVLSGGSACGLDSATGVMKYLEEQG